MLIKIREGTRSTQVSLQSDGLLQRAVLFSLHNLTPIAQVATQIRILFNGERKNTLCGKEKHISGNDYA